MPATKFGDGVALILKPWTAGIPGDIEKDA
jgi:hypothetical protein